MKKLLATVVLAGIASASAHAAAITLNLSAGQLSQPNGQPIPDGSLIQLVVSTQDASFSDPTALSFVGGSADDVVVASFAMNSASGGAPGVFSRPIVLEYNNLFDGKNIGAGMPIMLRFWPTLTTSATNPGAGLGTVGQFRRDTVDDFSDINWTLPGAPSTRGLNALTATFGGNTPSSALTATPEPTAGAMLALGALSFALRRRRS
jgi:hypothetical protein